ncbi:MAG: nuclear transport factor 2 family protein [Saprospiraceae bacterium]|nr:nuclear transport factor 2 family protein [Saprospiraceae bacterium]
MKNLFLICLTTLCLSTIYAQTADELAIQKLCETETQAWLSSDATTFNNCWQIRPYTRLLISTENNQTFAISADQMKAAQADAMGGGGSFANTNYLFHIDGNTAWVTYDEVKTDTKGLQHPSHELRLVEKVNGEWKIVGMSVHHYNPQQPASVAEATIRDLDAQEAKAIVEKNYATLEKLWSPNLMVNNPRNAISESAEAVKKALMNNLIDHVLLQRNIEKVSLNNDIIVTMGNEIVQDKPNEPQYLRRFTNIWMLQNGEWRLTYRHANKVIEKK